MAVIMVWFSVFVSQVSISSSVQITTAKEFEQSSTRKCIQPIVPCRKTLRKIVFISLLCIRFILMCDLVITHLGYAITGLKAYNSVYKYDFLRVSKTFS